MMWMTWASAIAATLGHVPVQGELWGVDGAPVSGPTSLDLRLCVGADGSGVFHEETQVVALTQGMFSVALGTATPFDLEALAGKTSLYLQLRPTGGDWTDAIAVGWAPRAAWAIRANEATNAENLGGHPAADHVRFTDGYTAGAGLALTGRAFGLSTPLPTESQVEGWITNGALGLAAGTTIGGLGFTESQIEAFITNGPLALPSGTTVAGAPHTEAQVETWITNGALGLAAGTTIGGAPLTEAQVETWVTNGPIALPSGSTVAGAPHTEAQIESWVTNGAVDLAAGSTVGGQALGNPLAGLSCSAGQFLRWSGTAWGCATPSASATGAFLARSLASSASDQASVAFNVEVFDDANAYNPSTGVFTAPSAGKYVFSWRVDFGNGAGTNRYRRVGLQINGSDAHGAETALSFVGNDGSNNTYLHFSDTMVVSLSASDQVRITTHGFGGYSGSMYAPPSFFSGFKLY
jgi:hypothetical protein